MALGSERSSWVATSRSWPRAASASGWRRLRGRTRRPSLLTRGLPAGDVCEAVAQQMDTAALPARLLHRLADWCLKAPARVGDHEVHPAESAVLQAREERGPEHGVLAIIHDHTEYLTAPSAVTPLAITTARETT